MTTEEKAKAYDEALKRAKEWITEREQIICPREIVESIFPELRESEDERMRKLIIDRVRSAAEMTEGLRELLLTYLEKQKENPKSADSIPSDCTSDAKYEGRWHNVKDSLPDSTREVLCKDAIGNYFIGRYYSKGVWEVSMYDDCDKSNEDNPPVVMWIDIPSEKQKEHFRDDTKKVEQKPAEWSEEEENELANIISIIEDEKVDAVKQYPKYKALHNAYDKRLRFLKSLRPVSKESLQPHWKPSEEEIEAVRYFVNKHQSEAWAATGQWKQFTALRGLLGNLEKLM